MSNLATNLMDLSTGTELPLVGSHPEIKAKLPEMIEIEQLAMQCLPHGHVRVEGLVSAHGHEFPIYSFNFGLGKATDPTVAFIGGVHGLERIGTNVAISYLRTVVDLIHWDKGVQHLMSKSRMVFVPLVNPAGMFAQTRSNANGVDLMRNSPIDAETEPNIPLIGGHRKSPKLPWYRGPADAPMEQEARILIDFIKRELFPSCFSLALDMHSGFGTVDRLWFPYAYSKRPFEHLPLMYALKTKMERSLPNHAYVMEPQSWQYTTHGDLWDFLLLESKKETPEHKLLPLTLEMGSWLWVKKNPRQMFSTLGIFNPVKPHRIQRTLRRHHGLLDFLMRAVASHENWAGETTLKPDYHDRAFELWYPDYSK